MTQPVAGIKPDQLALFRLLATPEMSAAAAGYGGPLRCLRFRASVGVAAGAVMAVPGIGLIALTSAVLPDDLGAFAGIMSIVGRCSSSARSVWSS